MSQRNIAVLSIDLKTSGVAPAEVNILPVGPFAAVDGRPGHGLMWQLDADIAFNLINKIGMRQSDIVIDYEHQSLNCQLNGQPAPAAGWFRSARWDKEKGLIATNVRWTEKARNHIISEEYRYVSAVFVYDKNGVVTEIISVALTNTPALDNLSEIAALCRQYSQELNDMPQPDNDVLNKLTGQVATLTSEKSQLSGQIAALSAERDALKKTLEDRDAAEAEAKAQAEEQEKNSLIEVALADGRLFPAEQEVAKEMNLSLLKKHLASKEAIADLSRQTKDKRGSNDTTHGLTSDELAACSKMGCSAEQYAAAKADLKKRHSTVQDD